MKTIGIEERISRNGTSYRASVMIEGKVIRKSFKTKNSAIKWKENIVNEREKNKRLGVGTKNYISYNELFEFFISSKSDKRHTTLGIYDSTNRNHIAPYIGNVTIRDLNLNHYDKIKSVMIKNKCSKHLVKKVTDLMKSVLNFAVKRSFLDFNFLVRIENVKLDETGFRYWKAAEIKSFLSKIEKDEYYYPFILFAFNTGLRRGELCGLKWENIDILNKSATFGNQRLSDGTIGEVKAGKTRTIPLTENAIKALKLTKKRSFLTNSSDFVFLNKKSKPINPDNITSTWKKIQKENGVERVMTLHSIRHSFASFLSSENIPIQVISKILGHSDIKVTQRYVHLNLNDLKESTKGLEL